MALLGRLWASARNATAAREELLNAMAAQRSDDLNTASRSLQSGVGIAVGASLAASLLLVLVVILGLRHVAAQFGELAAAMRRAARLESVFDDEAIRALEVSRVEEVARLQLAYQNISRAMYSFARRPTLPLRVRADDDCVTNSMMSRIQ